MNYEIQYSSDSGSVWFVWIVHKYIRPARRHVGVLRSAHNHLKFRIVRVTRKVVEG